MTLRTARRFTRPLLLALLVSAVFASCAVPPAAKNERVALKWGNPPMSHADIAYGPNAAHRADVYPATKGGNKGVIVLVSGGGFVTQDRRANVEASGIIMRQTHRGYAVVSAGYRTVDGQTNAFPTAVADISQAVNWVRAKGAAHGLNPRTVIVAGGSAGGTIAGLVGTGSNSPVNGALGRTAKVDGWISFAGIMDFPNATAKTQKYGRTWLGRNAGSAAWLKAASPAHHLDKWDPPAFIAHGDGDTEVEMAQVDLMLGAAARGGVTPVRIFFDKVTTGDGACRWHFPQCGVNATTLDSWFDLVNDRGI